MNSFPKLFEKLIISYLVIEIGRKLVNKINNAQRQKKILRRVFFRNRGEYWKYQAKT